MSWVDNWLLLPGKMDGYEHGPIAQVNARLEVLDVHRKQVFGLLDKDSWGGTKYPEVHVYGMASNHLPESSVFDAVRQASWSAPEEGVLLVHRQEGDAWEMWRLNALPQD